MKDGSFEKVETHEVRYVGILSAEQVRKAITDAVYSLVGVSSYESGLALECELFSWVRDHDVRFVLVKDYLCYRLPIASEAGET